jgi:hypothetical protein
MTSFRKLTKGVRALHTSKLKIERELTKWKAQATHWKKLFDEQASLNCTLVGQNTKLIERNLVLGDTPTPYSWEPKWCVYVRMSEPLPRTEAEEKAEELRTQGQHAGIVVDWEGRKV